METILGVLEVVCLVHERLSSQLATHWRADYLSLATGVELVAKVFLEARGALLETYDRYAMWYAGGMASLCKPAVAAVMHDLTRGGTWEFDEKFGWIAVEDALSLPLAYAMDLRDLFGRLRAPTSRASEPSSAALEAVCATLDSMNAALARATASHRAAAEGGEGRMLST